ncbi:N-acetylglucosamine-6-phosphate deacetylase [Streptomyces sp. SID3343]|uniref:N-acetylglucosamine-6-phosphate deacetylase n=1 Tax=Streptomyces sp. SID3343 TaxID=2690260 RepID=UPI0013719A26|nr:N-acetylglucosamine-6-phosphate deacetylase [Streptomyces sp. SID3343]
MTVLGNARVVLPSGVVEGASVRVVDDRIAFAGPGIDDPSDRLIDVGGGWIVPGFVDMHVHGGGGGSYTSGDAEEALRVAEFHRSHGTTTTIASLVTASPVELLRTVRELAPLVHEGRLAGLHLEGPYLSKVRCGAHDPTQLRSPDRDEVSALLKAAAGAIRMVTLAPELPGGIELVRRLADEGVIAAVGHTDGTHRETRAALAAGASVATHLFNAMRSVHHREPGPVTALLQDSDAVVELINDGVHLHPSVVNLAYASAGPDRVAFITDAMGAAGMPDGVYPLGVMTVDVVDGVARLTGGESIAGSTLTLDRALRNGVAGGLPIADVARSLSATPARALGIADELGTLEAGKRADLVVLDDALEVRAVLAAGVWVDARRP